MKYSVVIPLYNKEHYIKKALLSVLSQKVIDDFEVIVVNDGSTDTSLAVASSVKSDKIRIITQENQGVAIARNIGIEQARGKYIAFLDADDEWHEDYLQTIEKLTNLYAECDIYVTAYRIVMGSKRYNYSAHLSDEDICIESYWGTFKNAYDIVWTSATVIKRQAVIDAGMFTPGEKIGQDLDLWARIARNNPKVAYSPNICVDYNRSAEQNARTRVKIAHPKGFLSVLETEMNNDRWNDEDKKWMLSKYNRKMVVYVFTSILSGKRKEAREIIHNWKKKYPNKFIIPLFISSFLPKVIVSSVYGVRMKVF